MVPHKIPTEVTRDCMGLHDSEQFTKKSHFTLIVAEKQKKKKEKDSTEASDYRCLGIYQPVAKVDVPTGGTQVFCCVPQGLPNLLVAVS